MQSENLRYVFVFVFIASASQATRPLKASLNLILLLPIQNVFLLWYNGTCLVFGVHPISATYTGCVKTTLSILPQVLVNVLDVNDVTPTFPRAYEGPFEVTEGQPGPRVWTLRASDEDSGLNGKVEYSITGGDHQS